jgi:protein-S-isoprenylcysteine O-methyltransferase Ste14
MLLAHVRKTRMEERALDETFPGDHETYRRETWAWIPGLY